METRSINSPSFGMKVKVEGLNGKALEVATAAGKKAAALLPDEFTATFSKRTELTARGKEVEVDGLSVAIMKKVGWLFKKNTVAGASATKDLSTASVEAAVAKAVTDATAAPRKSSVAYK